MGGRRDHVGRAAGARVAKNFILTFVARLEFVASDECEWTVHGQHSVHPSGKTGACGASTYTLTSLMMDPEKYAAATVVSRRDPAPDLWIIRIRTDTELPYRPGQYVTLGLQSNGKVVERPYSIC